MADALGRRSATLGAQGQVPKSSCRRRLPRCQGLRLRARILPSLRKICESKRIRPLKAPLTRPVLHKGAPQWSYAWPVRKDIGRPASTGSACGCRTTKAGPLFCSTARTRGGKDSKAPYKKVGERLAAWVRALGVSDEGVKPNHGWRRCLTSILIGMRTPERVIDSILRAQGSPLRHSPPRREEGSRRPHPPRRI